MLPKIDNIFAFNFRIFFKFILPRVIIYCCDVTMEGGGLGFCDEVRRGGRGSKKHEKSVT